MKTTLRALIAAGLVVGVFGWAVAKLPPPPMDEKAKAAAEDKKSKDASAAAADQAALVRAQDRAVADYMAAEKAKGVIVKPQTGPTPHLATSAPPRRPARK